MQSQRDKNRQADRKLYREIRTGTPTDNKTTMKVHRETDSQDGLLR